MSKVGYFQKGWRGKAAGIVYAKTENGTVARELVVPSNPQTRAQMAQRIIFATVTQAAVQLKPIINHSFEGSKYGNKSVQQFISRNLNEMRAMAAEDYANNATAETNKFFATTKGISALIPNQYVVSQGSLAPARVKVVADTAIGGLRLSLPGITGHTNSNPARVPVTVSDTGVMTAKYGDLIQAMFGISEKAEQLTLVSIINQYEGYKFSYLGATDAGFQIPDCVMNASRLVVKSTLSWDDVLTLGIVAEGVFTPNEDMDDNINMLLAYGAWEDDKSAQILKSSLQYIFDDMSYSVTQVGGVWGLNFLVDSIDGTSTQLNEIFGPGAADGTAVVMAAGVIRSKFDGTKWRRSNTQLVTTPPVGNTAFRNYGLLWSAAYDAWMRGAEVAESERFLNEGTEYAQAGESF